MLLHAEPVRYLQCLWMDADPPTPVDGTLARETVPYLYPITGSPIKLWKSPAVL